MKPIVIPKRVTIPGGLWSNKVSGDFQEGDPSKTSFFVEGNVEIKELAGQSRLFFQNVQLTKRRIIFNDKERLSFITTYRSERGIDEDAAGELMIKDKDEKARQLQEEVLALETSLKTQQAIKIKPPHLSLFLTKKKPKTRMIDVHKTGSQIPLKSDPDGLFGNKGTLGNFEASVKGVPDLVDYIGVVVLKLPTDEPLSEEPGRALSCVDDIIVVCVVNINLGVITSIYIYVHLSLIFGILRLHSNRFNKINTPNALNLVEMYTFIYLYI